MTGVTVSNLSVTLRGRPAVDRASFSLAPGELVGLVGPNGAGKTTLLRAMLGLLSHAGTCTLAEMAPSDRARTVAWLPQARDIAWPVSVEMLVTLGRLPHLAGGQKAGPEDCAAVDSALGAMDLHGFRARAATRLSGGEQARALIARALAQETPVLLADEPMAGLDPAHQIAAMKTFAGLAGAGRTVLVSIHDLGLAVRHCSRLLLMSGGRLVADGPPADVLTEARLAEVFHLRAFYRQTPDGPVYQPLDILDGAAAGAASHV